ncbi:MAG: hypothetical protein WCJ09_13040, partial [Planctomycetota bacterium]
MPRTVSPAGMPTSVDVSATPVVITCPFPDLRRPKKGNWTITVPISTDSDCPVVVLVELIQQQPAGLVTIAASSFTASSTVTNCVLSIPDSVAIKGGCNLSGLKIRMTVQEYCSPCCVDTGVPPELTMSMTGDYTGTGTLTGGGGLWTGTLIATPSGDWPGG